MEDSLLTNRERFKRVLNFEPVDRLPVVEWAHWWDRTISRWHGEGLPTDLNGPEEIRDYFGLDVLSQCWIGPQSADFPRPTSHGAGVISSPDDYAAVKKHLYGDMPFAREWAENWRARQESGDAAVWISLEGPFWFPRTLFGIEPHLMAFYDEPSLMKEMNDDLLKFNLRVFDEICEVAVPDFMTFAEDMSYNHGPMLSKSLFDEFMAPFYQAMVPKILERGTVPFVDTDGDVTESAEWFAAVGIKGLLPLERMAGVDIAALRRANPKLNMIGAFDKTVMHLGEARVRQEFERILPVMRQGGYIPGVDHQTPPEVSLDDYRQYVRLLKEYCEQACR
jgi:uroporphyrinogen-III decarboxylase